MIYLHLFVAFFTVSLFAVGGGYAAIPLIQAQAVDHYHWMTMAQFSDLVSISEMTPGPIAINAATFAGMQMVGFLGALVATIAYVLPAMIIMSILYKLYAKYGKLAAMQRALRVMKAVVVALIASAGLNILISFVTAEAAFDILGALLFAAAFCVLRKWKINPIFILLLCGAAGLALGVAFGW